MNDLARSVRDYWCSGRKRTVLDPVVLQTCIDNLEPYERQLLEKGVAVCAESDSLRESFDFLLIKIRNRHYDISSQCTIVDEDGHITYTDRSCVSELEIHPNTYGELVEHSLTRIRDVTKEALVLLSLDAIADVTAALVLWYTSHDTDSEEDD